MGVKYLWKILSPCGEHASLENKTLAIDTSIWIYQYRHLPTHIIVFSFCRRLFRILYTKIRPVFIFDGTPPSIKLKIMEERRKAAEKLELKRFLLNKKCEICGEGIQTCLHYKEMNQEQLEKLNKEAFEKMKTHTYNWGELSDDFELDEYFNKKDVNKLKENKVINEKAENELNDFSIFKDDELNNLQFNFYNDNSIATFDEKSLENLSKVRQLEMLVDLRLKRKLPMTCDVSSSSNFSNSQIENVKKRNQITTLIKNLNKDSSKIVYSDCKVESMLKKSDEVNIYSNFCYIDEKEEIASETIEKDNRLDNLENLFDEYEEYMEKRNPIDFQHNENVKRFKTNDKFNLNPNIIDDQINQNKLLSKTINKNENTNVFPLNNPVVMSTAELLYNEFNQNNLDSDASIDPFSSEVNNEMDNKDMIMNGDPYLDVESSNDIEAENLSNKKVLNEYEFNDDNAEIRKLKQLIIEILKIFEIPCIQAPGETDLQCWYLFKNKLIDGVISEDSDMIIYGTSVYKNFFRKDKDILCFSFENVQEKLNLSQDDLIKLAYLLGCDYCDGVKGIGMKRAIEKLNTVTSDEINFLSKIYKGESIGNKDNSENTLAIQEIKELKFGTLKRNKLRYYLVEKGLEESKIEELMFYMTKVQEIYNE